MLGGTGAIEVVNQYATHVAADSRHCSERFEELFQEFLKNLKAAGYPLDFMFDQSCEDPVVLRVRDSYWELLHCFKSEIRYNNRRKRKRDQDCQG
ncbi:hypothetical protein ABOM_005713 [Aspergillus bombycis]|uniref:Uncharacterized protein n=1 Tax=Aspergillus bombycis TaxID=109264 RepID=A0A1F8A313_9EURO|nr:hypothetical protein ABOM_005713 [Aspergillus bombycis]OGM46116.1 hypothetical protein ABOM_005713 [Aspergillus bombycis]